MIQLPSDRTAGGTLDHPMRVSASVQPIDTIATKNVFTSALRFAMSVETVDPTEFCDELKASAQEQVEYMLAVDEETCLVIFDEEVKSVVRLGLSEVFSSFLDRLSSLLLLESDLTFGSAEKTVIQMLADIEWLCKVLPKMELIKDLVSRWIDVSNKILEIIQNAKLTSRAWGVKVKLVEVTGKVLEAVGYGNVILHPRSRVNLLKTWMPFMRKLKPLVDSKGSDDTDFVHKMDEDLCEGVEGSIVSLVLALPSNDQAEVLGDWVRGIELDQSKFPDLSEAFEIWCYRSKSAKRRLLERCDRLANSSLAL